MFVSSTPAIMLYYVQLSELFHVTILELTVEFVNL